MNRADSPLTLQRMTARSLYRRPMRTSLTVVGVSVGVMAIVAFSTLMRGMWDAVDATIHSNDADLIVFQADVAADMFSVLDEEETYDKLRSIPDVREAVGVLWHIVRLEEIPLCLVLGLRLKDASSLQDDLIRGRYPQADDELMLGSIISRALEKDLNDTIAIQGESYRVVGVFQTDVIFYNGAIFMSLPRLQELAAREGLVTLFQVHLQDDADPAEVAGQVEREIPEVVAISDASEYHKVDQGLEMGDDMVWAVSLMAIIIGGIVVANTMWMSVLERTREIGVLRAIGWSRRRIVAMILSEAAGVGLVACVVGCVAGVALAELTAILPFAEQFAQVSYSPSPFVLALVIAVVLSVLGALVPAWRAARISPAEALRYE